MRNTPLVKTAVVRGVPASYTDCIRYEPHQSIDVTLARQQHAAYCDVLRRLGVDVVKVAADDRYPDCCFVEDPVLVVDEYAILTSMGAASRRGEGEALREVMIRRGKTLVEIEGAGTLEGGDVLAIDDRLVVGLTGRTNREGLDALGTILGRDRFEILELEVPDALHLKSVCAYLGEGHIVVVQGYADEPIFSDYERIEVAAADAYGANCIALNAAVVVAEGFPEVTAAIRDAGFETIEIPMSEFCKGDGGLSCLSVRF